LKYQVTLREVNVLEKERNIENDEAMITENNGQEEIVDVVDVEILDAPESDGAVVQLTNSEKLAIKLEEYENKILRMQADFDNFRRRTRLDREAAEKYKAQSLATNIIPALDNFERALKVEADDEKTKLILQGMEIVYRQLCEALKNEGVEIIEAVGNKFDPHQHQAVMQVQENDYEPNTIIEEFQKGYKLKDRVIRPSMVKVNG
jgi:molecular chaperone GrpE